MTQFWACLNQILKFSIQIQIYSKWTKFHYLEAENYYEIPIFKHLKFWFTHVIIKLDFETNNRINKRLTENWIMSIEFCDY